MGVGSRFWNTQHTRWSTFVDSGCSSRRACLDTRTSRGKNVSAARDRKVVAQGNHRSPDRFRVLQSRPLCASAVQGRPGIRGIRPGCLGSDAGIPKGPPGMSSWISGGASTPISPGSWKRFQNRSASIPGPSTTWTRSRGEPFRRINQRLSTTSWRTTWTTYSIIWVRFWVTGLPQDDGGCSCHPKR